MGPDFFFEVTSMIEDPAERLRAFHFRRVDEFLFAWFFRGLTRLPLWRHWLMSEFASFS